MGNFPSGGKARLILIGGAIAACFLNSGLRHVNDIPLAMEGIDAF
jgi:hypothetical protein